MRYQQPGQVEAVTKRDIEGNARGEGIDAPEDPRYRGPDAALRELELGIAEGGKPPTRREKQLTADKLVQKAIARHFDELSKVGFTDALADRLCLEALACLRYACRRGNVRAAIFLVEATMGRPRQPFSVEIRTQTPAELAKQFAQQLAALDLPPAVVSLVSQRFVAAAAVTDNGAEVPAMLPSVGWKAEREAAAEAAGVPVPGGYQPENEPTLLAEWFEPGVDGGVEAEK